MTEKVQSDKSKIASSVAKDLTKDIKRWQKEGTADIHQNFKGKTDSEIANIIASKIEKNISKQYGYQNTFTSKDGKVSIVIDGITEYGDEQPLEIEYDTKNNKVTNIWWA